MMLEDLDYMSKASLDFLQGQLAKEDPWILWSDESFLDDPQINYLLYAVSTLPEEHQDSKIAKIVREGADLV